MLKIKNIYMRYPRLIFDKTQVCQNLARLASDFLGYQEHLMN